MRSLLFILIPFLFASPAIAQKDTGNEREFMTYCKNKQTDGFCQCALKSGFEYESQLETKISQKKIQSREKQVTDGLKRSKKLDPSLTREQFDALCDISDIFQKEKNDYYESVSEKPLSQYEYGSEEFYLFRVAHSSTTQEIRKKYVPKIKALHEQFGSNKITRRHYNVEGGAGYCLQRRLLAKDISLQQNSSTTVKINFQRMFSNATKTGVACREIFKAPTIDSAWQFDDFWQTNKLPYIIGAVFNGIYNDPINASFKTYFRTLQSAYYNACKEDLSEKSLRRGFISQKVYGDGSRGRIEEYILLVDPRFVKKYDEYKSAHAKHATARIQKDVSKVLAGSQSLLGALSASPSLQFSRFINGTGCRSNDVNQLRENFLRKAYGRPSLQQERREKIWQVNKNIANAEKRIFDTCNDTPYDASRYCSCFAPLATNIMTYSEFKYFSQNFKWFYKDVSGKIDQSRNPIPAGERIWTLNGIHNQCIN